MAKYKFEMHDGVITKTLTFMGREFIETTVEDGTFCAICMAAIVYQALPDLPWGIGSIIEELTYMEEDELIYALNALSDYEKDGNLK